MPFVFGDSYGGVQAASQAAQNSDRNLLLSLMQAQQIGQRFAMEQANRSALAGQNWALGQQDRADRNAMNRINLDESRRIQDTNIDLALLGFEDRRLAAQEAAKIEAAKRKALIDAEMGKVNVAGPALANRFSELLNERNTAAEEFARIQQEALANEQEIARYLEQNQIVPVDGAKDVYKASGMIGKEEPAAKENVRKINDAIQRYKVELAEKAKNLDQVEKDLRRQLQVIESSSFIPTQGGIVYPKTGQAFKFPENSQKVRRLTYDRATDTFK